jgi:hypothetical protein
MWDAGETVVRRNRPTRLYRQTGQDVAAWVSDALLELVISGGDV